MTNHRATEHRNVLDDPKMTGWTAHCTGGNCMATRLDLGNGYEALIVEGANAIPFDINSDCSLGLYDENGSRAIFECGTVLDALAIVKAYQPGEE